MAILFIPERGKNDPLHKEPYLTFNKKFSEIIGNLDREEIKICYGKKQSGFCNGFTFDSCYCHRINLEFVFSGAWDTESGKDIMLVHHVFDYKFDPSYLEFEQEMALEMTKRENYIYIPGAKQFNISYRLISDHMQLIFDIVTEKSLVQETCNILISNDIAIFSRGW